MEFRGKCQKTLKICLPKIYLFKKCSITGGTKKTNGETCHGSRNVSMNPLMDWGLYHFGINVFEKDMNSTFLCPFHYSV